MEKDLELIKHNIKYVDENLIKTHISGITEENIDECLKMIIEENPNINFVTIQYSKRDRRIYFYTDDEINVEKWTDKNKKVSGKYLITSIEILEEIKRVFLINEDEQKSCISIYDADYIIPLSDVLNLLKEYEQQYSKIKDDYKELIISSYRDRFKDEGCCYISGYDHRTKRLSMGFSPYYLSDYSHLEFYKYDDDLKVNRKDGYINTEEIFLSSGKYIDELITNLNRYDDFKLQQVENIRSVNSKFKIDISCFGIELKTDGYNFRLELYSYSDKPNYYSTSNNLISLLDKKELELFNKIYVRIDECPDWMHGTLYEKRKEALENKARQKEKEQKAKEKQEKKNNRKIKFKFFKKDK